MVVVLPPIILGAPVKEKKGILQIAKEILTFDIRKFTKDPVKTGIVGITGVAIPKTIFLKAAKLITPKRVFLGLTAIGIAQTSPTAVKFVLEKLRDPTATGRAIGDIIEDPSILQPDIPSGETTKEKVLETFKTAGIIGGIAALTAAVFVLGKKIKKIKAAAPGLPGIPGLPGLPGKPGVQSFATLPPIPPTSPVIEPIAAVKKPEEEKPVTPTMPDINIKNIIKPEINVRVSQNRKFINQQILIRQHART